MFILPHCLRTLLFTILITVTPFLATGQVERKDTIITWDRFAYTLDPDYSIQTHSTTDIVEVQFDAIVIENELVKICLVPEFGGRVISFIYKPTGKEQLYQNEVGTPYLIDANIFYHDWLMVYGGIFPTFPEPEHGKYWNVPWEVDVIADTGQKVVVSMWKKDDLSNPGHPGNYNNGVTGITCYFDISVERGKPYFEVDVRLENDGSFSRYEYWTCITFAPGSEPGDPSCPGNSKMVVPIEQYQVGWNAGNWMRNADEVVSFGPPRIQRYENLALLSNWEDQGIAYAWPDMQENYYGVINLDNDHGLFRMTDDQSVTPGLKFWTWGDRQGSEADASDFWDYARPYIELWSGVSHEFFDDATIGADQAIGWKETYLPTVGLPDIRFLNKEIAFYYQVINGRVLEILSFYPVRESEIELSLSLTTGMVPAWEEERVLQPHPSDAGRLTIDLTDLGLDPGSYELDIQLLSNQISIYEATEVLDLDATGVADRTLEEATVRTGKGYMELTFRDPSKRTIRICNSQGRIIRSTQSHGKREMISGLVPGVYVIQIVEIRHEYARKVYIH